MDGRPLKIIHCFRSPVGGIFRHVRDLVERQVADGHEIGILCDSITGGRFEERLIEEIAPQAALGVHRVALRRAIVPTDLVDLARTYRMLRRLEPDVLHGHGAKGGAYARLVGTAIRMAGHPVARLYTPHGGSMHYDPKTVGGRIFFALERALEKVGDHLLFVSQYEEDAYRTKVGQPRIPARVVYNGLAESEFVPVVPNADASDFLYLGMLRALKGPDLLVRALAEIRRTTGKAATATIVGAGEQKEELEALAAEIVPGCVRFHDPMPAREAMRLGRILVLPSRNDSLPYVVMEALAAGRPVVAAAVGGVREILPPTIQPLAAPDDPAALAEAMLLRQSQGEANPEALVAHVRSRFVIDKMAADIAVAYGRAAAHGGQTVQPAVARRGAMVRTARIPPPSQP